MTSDDGFAPNPYYGYCTLACCKEDMRKNMGKTLHRHREEDDFIREQGIYIIGVAGKRGLEKQMRNPSGKDFYKGSQIVYIMQVTEVLTFEEYWENPRFEDKKPHGTNLLKTFESQKYKDERVFPKEVRGDNVYNPSCPDEDLPCFHYWSDDEKDHAKQRGTDLGGRYVLVSDNFVYFGDCSSLPDGKTARFVGKDSPYYFNIETSKYPQAIRDGVSGTLINTGVNRALRPTYGENGKYDIPKSQEGPEDLADFIVDWMKTAQKEGRRIFGDPISLKGRTGKQG